MKTLFLIRHGKSDWKQDLRDFDRPLNSRGINDAPKVGKYLFENYDAPDLILSSSATRAISTARLMSPELSYDLSGIEQIDDLYHASPKTIIQKVNQVEKWVDNLFLFGHNPGISQCVSVLTDQFVEMKTCCACVIHCEIDSWQEVMKGTGILEEYISPKAI